MIEKDVVINMLEDIEQCLYSENWKKKTLGTVNQYRKGLVIATNSELKLLIEEYSKYDENSTEALELSKIISDKIQNIYNDKIGGNV